MAAKENESTQTVPPASPLLAAAPVWLIVSGGRPRVRREEQERKQAAKIVKVLKSADPITKAVEARMHGLQLVRRRTPPRASPLAMRGAVEVQVAEDCATAPACSRSTRARVASLASAHASGSASERVVKHSRPLARRTPPRSPRR